MYNEEAKFEADKLMELINELKQCSVNSENTWAKVIPLSKRTLDKLKSEVHDAKELDLLSVRFNRLAVGARKATHSCESQYLEHVGVEQTEQDSEYVRVFNRPDYRAYGIDFTELKKQLLKEAVAIKEARSKIAIVIAELAKVKMMLAE